MVNYNRGSIYTDYGLIFIRPKKICYCCRYLTKVAKLSSYPLKCPNCKKVKTNKKSNWKIK